MKQLLNLLFNSYALTASLHAQTNKSLKTETNTIEVQPCSGMYVS